jgi:hypothetical protein
MPSMLPLAPDFTPLEQAVLSDICEEHSTDRAAMEAQLATATLKTRENTGAGFFTYFDVQQIGITPIGGRRLRDGPNAKIKGLQHGMGFILWFKEGYAHCLEGYAYADPTTTIDWHSVSFELDPVLKR